MRFASALARGETSGEAAVTSALQVLDAELDAAPELLLVFVSTGLLKESPAILARLRERFPSATLIGSSGSGVLGAGREAEGVPALSVLAASLPGVHLEARALRALEVPVFERAPKALLLFADPFSFEAEATLERLAAAFPGVVLAGGLASGGSSPGSHRLFLDERVHTSGAVCVAISGAVEVEVRVAQGCQPVGPPRFATAVDGHLLLELDGKSPLDVLQKLHAESPPDLQARLRHALVVGVGAKTGRVETERSELLVRNLVGLEPSRRALAVRALLEPLQVIQFMVRDAAAASEALAATLSDVATPPAGALVVTSAGRGRALFGRDDHDASALAARFPGTPSAGLFCNGELGPVGGRGALHGSSCVLVLFRPPPH